ncbi:hypothetical protein V5O48_013512, partial [Marasmius crinis-equi]
MILPLFSVLSLAAISTQALSIQATTCTQRYTVKDGDYCDLIEAKLHLKSGTIVKLNADTVDDDCGNLDIGQVICVATGSSSTVFGASSSTCTPTTTSTVSFTAGAITSTTKATITQSVIATHSSIMATTTVNGVNTITVTPSPITSTVTIVNQPTVVIPTVSIITTVTTTTTGAAATATVTRYYTCPSSSLDGRPYLASGTGGGNLQCQYRGPSGLSMCWFD